MEGIEAFKDLREKLAHLLLNTPATGLHTVFEENRDKGLQRAFHFKFKWHPLTAEEEKFANQQMEILCQEPQVPDILNHLFAAMLYMRPYEVPVLLDFEKVPAWFQEDYLMFLLEYPKGVLKSGEADQYYRHIKQLIHWLSDGIQESPDSKRWAERAMIFAKCANMMPLYFTKNPLREIFVKRGEILSHLFQSYGWNLEYTFKKGQNADTKIKFGVYLAYLDISTELQATLPLFEFVDRDEFEVFLYVSQHSGNDKESYFQEIVDHLVVLPGALKDWPNIIRSDDLDVLFFGNNSTAGLGDTTMLGCHRLARLQCVHFCSPVTTGLKNIDCFLMGTLVDPKNETEDEFSENVLKIEGSGICFSRGREPKTEGRQFTRMDFGMPEEAVVFVSGANFNKITAELRYLWAIILAGTEDSMLVLYPFGPAWQKEYPDYLFREEMKKAFRSYGVSESRLMILDPFEKQEDIPSFLRLADVYLDATPYSGATSLLDPLGVGLPPVVTEAPELRFCQGAAMLRELGVPDLIATDDESYIQLAIRLAADDRLRYEISAKISENMAQGPAFLDSRAYGGKVGRVLKSISKRGSSLRCSKIGEKEGWLRDRAK